MNKKVVIGIIVAVILVALVSAFFLINGNKENKGTTESENNAQNMLDNSNSTTNNNSDDNDDRDTSSDEKVLVVYFSKAGENYNVGTVNVGNTAMMASYIKEYLKADSFEIEPIEKYPDDYSEAIKKAQEEQNTDARPEIKNKINNFDDYDTIFIGYPIWYGDMPQIVYTFLESYDFSGKKVIPFNTHEGSGASGTYSTIKSKLSSASVFTNGLAIQGKVARTDDGKTQTINWLKELGY